MFIRGRDVTTLILVRELIVNFQVYNVICNCFINKIPNALQIGKSMLKFKRGQV